MSISKYAFGRYRIIDRELSRKEWVKTKELKKIIESDLSIRVCEKTITNDINAMRYDSALGYYAPIEWSNKYKAHFYSDRNYTIKAFGLKEDDINALMFYASTLNQYKEYDIFKDFSGAIEKVLDAVTIRKGITKTENPRSILHTEQTPNFTGSELIPIIIQALDETRIIEFIYQKFDDSKPKLVSLKPYLLKEDRHRWYIIGKNEKIDRVFTTYALDRIHKLKITDDKFESIKFDFEKYFAYSFGITVTDKNPIKVILSFTPSQGKYLKTLQLHNTQEILIDDDKEFRISVLVKPSYEFYEKILGYGENVRVIEPKSVIETMKETINTLAKFYK